MTRIKRKSILSSKEKVLLHGGNILSFGIGMFGPLLALFTERIGGSVLDVAWAWAIYLIVMGIFYIVVGNISDKNVKKEKIMLSGYVLHTLFTFGYLLVRSPSHLFLIQAGLGIAYALLSPTWLALYAKYENKQHAGFTWGLAGGEAMILTGIGVVIGGFIVTYLSFNILFITMGTIQAIAALYQSRILKT